MGILWMNFIVVYTASLASRYFSRPLNRDPYVKPNKFFILLVIASLVVIAGLRSNIGDTYFYMHSYEIGHFDLKNIDFRDDFGF
ncbi:MAG TPA: EpsG family protein, partial [Bacillales bacterium]|nr:EpsG family protein [Bacillales bacterium]